MMENMMSTKNKAIKELTKALELHINDQGQHQLPTSLRQAIDVAIQLLNAYPVQCSQCYYYEHAHEVLDRAPCTYLNTDDDVTRDDCCPHFRRPFEILPKEEIDDEKANN